MLAQCLMFICSSKSKPLALPLSALPYPNKQPLPVTQIQNSQVYGSLPTGASVPSSSSQALLALAGSLMPKGPPQPGDGAGPPAPQPHEPVQRMTSEMERMLQQLSGGGV